MQNTQSITATDEMGGKSGAAERIAVSVVVPAFNEETLIGTQIESIQHVMRSSGHAVEIIVVDDGSTDRTATEVERRGVRLVRLPRNRGYGAALKAGIAAAANEWVVIIDADGTYPAEAIPAMLANATDYDMVVGARVGKNVHVPLARQPAKWFLQRLASYLVQQPIPDLNSGLRVMRKSLVERFQHLLPSGFSFTTTITLALLSNDFRVHYHPIEYRRRGGQSKIRPAHAYEFLLLILRTIVYFNPLRVFLPLGALPFFLGFGKLIYDIAQKNITDSAVMGILTGIILWAVGLLADQISRVSMAARPK